MKFVDAKKLHNEDEVILKRTNEILTVLNAYETTNNVNKPQITIEAISSNLGYITVTHKDIR